MEEIHQFSPRVQDWPTLEAAVDQKLDEQDEFVRWWRGTVTPRHGLNRHSVDNAERRYLTVAEAESLTGITQQQVSKWAKKLQKREAYRAQLFGAAYKAAMMSQQDAETFNHRAQGTGENETPYGKQAKEALNDAITEAAEFFGLGNKKTVAKRNPPKGKGKGKGKAK